MSEPSPLQPALLHSIEACLAARGDPVALREALDELRPWTDELSRFAVDLFELQLVRLGDAEARAAASELATRLLEWWDSGSGARLAPLVPHLEEVWLDAASTLASFEAVRFERALQACWAARDDVDALAEQVTALRPDGNQRVEFARCLIHLRLARLGRPESRPEFARRVELLTAAWKDPALLETLIGRDEGLRELWDLLLPLLRSFFGEATAPATAEPHDGGHGADAPPATSSDAAPAPTPPSAEEVEASEPLEPPTSPEPGPAEGFESSPPGDLAPEPISLFEVDGASAVTAPHTLDFAGNADADAEPRLETSPAPRADRRPISIEFDITEVLDDTPRPGPLPATGPPKPPRHTVDEAPPPRARGSPAPKAPPAARGPHRAAPPSASGHPSPPPAASATSSTSVRAPPRSLDIEDTGHTPTPEAAAFWKKAISALDLLPRPDEQRLAKRLMPVGTKDERARMGAFAASIEDAIHIPDARAFACLVQLVLAGQTRDRGLFGKSNEQRSELLASALSLLSANPRAAGRAAVWFELDGRDAEAELQSGLELLADYIAHCARSRLDPLDARAQRNYLRSMR